ncbi:MAG: hypothetical protein AB8I08_03125 [Sandaracinaceae bacterium]
MRILIGLVVFSLGCASSAGSAGGTAHHRAGFPEASGNDEVMRDGVPAQSGTALSVSLSSEPEVVIGERDDMSMHVVITNEGHEDVIADALAAELRIDGDDPIELDLAGHGFTHLAPGQSVEWDENLGVRLLSPGDHTLQLDVGEAHSTPIHVLVRE